MTTAERIKRARQNAGLTQEQLAHAVGVASITVSRWERELHEPHERQFVRIAEATGSEIDDLHAVEAIA